MFKKTCLTIAMGGHNSGRDPGVQIHPGCADCLGTYVSGAPLVVLSHGFSSNHEGNFGETHREGKQ